MKFNFKIIGGNMNKFIYNTKTGKLHIEGFCKYANSNLYNNKIFNTEEEALGFDGRCLGMCKLCENKRKELMKK